MATINQEQIFIVPSFDAGMQIRSTEFLAQKGELQLCVNADPTVKIGAITKGLGYTKKGNTGASGGTILGAGKLNTSGGTDKIIMFVGTDAYVYNSTTGAWDAQSRTFTASQKFEVASFLNMMFVVNGLTDAPESYSGAAWSTSINVTDMPKARYIVIHNNRVYLFNVTIPIGGAFPSRSMFCDLPKNNAITWDFESGTDLATTASSAVITSAGSLFLTRGIKAGDTVTITTDADAGEYEVESVDSETQITLTETLSATDTNVSFWVGGNWFDVERDNSDIGMGIGVNFNRVLFFKRHSVHKFYKSPDRVTDSLLPINGCPGTTSHRSIVSKGAYTYWWSDTGLWRTNGDSGELISGALQEIVDGISDANLSTIVGWVDNDRTVKMFLGDISNTETGLTLTKAVFCYDVIANAYWIEELSDTINASVEWVAGTAKKQNFIFNNAGECFQTQSGNSYDGDEIHMRIYTHPMYAISPEVEVNYLRFKIYGEHLGSITIPGWKRCYYADGQKDADFQSVKILHQTEHEIEIKTDENMNKSSGFILGFLEAASNTRPSISRIVAYHTGGNLR